MNQKQAGSYAATLAAVRALAEHRAERRELRAAPWRPVVLAPVRRNVPPAERAVEVRAPLHPSPLPYSIIPPPGATQFGQGEKAAPKDLCSQCGADCTAQNFMCDEEMTKVWCPKCFAATSCGRGEHGEGCPTAVGSLTAENAENTKEK